MRLLFQISIGLAALFIAGCSAYFSVRGLGLLFAGAAIPVMIMAASLEAGKLVAASFLYQYWHKVGMAVRCYLMFAVVVLVGITSLGIYGYLARAYERTNSEVTLLQTQIESIQREIADTQQRIETSRNQIGKTSDTERQDREKLREQVKQANDSMEQSLARVEDRRKSARAKRDRDAEAMVKQGTQSGTVIEQSLARLEDRRKATREKRDAELARLDTRVADAAKELAAGIESEDKAIAALNENLAVLDRAVDAYTKEGGAGFLKDDSIKKGQELRKQQQAQRDTIAAEIAKHRETQDKLRAANETARKAIDEEVAAVKDRFVKDTAALDDEEKTQRKALADTGTSSEAKIAALNEKLAKELAEADDAEKAVRKANEDSIASLDKQLAALQAKDQAFVADGGVQIESLYQRIRSGNEEIRHLQERIAATDVGSYRFVARAFNAPVDDVVKWLIMIIVAVFDPLAVALTIGFNVALTGGRRSTGASPEASGSSPSSSASGTPARESVVAGPRGGRVAIASVGVVLALLVIGGTGYFVSHAMGRHPNVAASAAVPTDSFAVVAIRPALFRAQADAKGDGVKQAGFLSQPFGAAIADLLSSGFDPNADVYFFAKYPSDRVEKPTERPVVICGMVASISDQAAAEASLSRCAESIAKTLRPASSDSPALSRNRVMVQSGRGKYLDPEGGFFTFAVTPTEAILMLEIEGDPVHPRVAGEIRRCLGDVSTERSLTYQSASAPQRLMPDGGAIAVWFDGNRCFSDMPKTPAAQTRYQQLGKHLNFDFSLIVRPTSAGEVELSGEYAYSGERFRDRASPAPIELLAKLGPADAAGVPGRLMDRCADTLDFDSLIDRLRGTLSNPRDGGPRALVVVEKETPTVRDGKFLLTARYDSKTSGALAAVVRSLSPF